MKKIFLKAATFLTGAVVLAASCAKSFTQYVNPLIGSGGHGHVFVGANVPFGIVQAGPVQYSTGWDWCSGYHYSDSTIIGFAQMHLSGTGIGDLGYYSVMLDGSGIRAEMTSTPRVAFHRYTFRQGQSYDKFYIDYKEPGAFLAVLNK